MLDLDVAARRTTSNHKKIKSEKKATWDGLIAGDKIR